MPSDTYQIEGLDKRESVCTRCNLVFWTETKFAHLANDCTGRK